MKMFTRPIHSISTMWSKSNDMKQNLVVKQFYKQEWMQQIKRYVYLFAFFRLITLVVPRAVLAWRLGVFPALLRFFFDSLCGKYSASDSSSISWPLLLLTGGAASTCLVVSAFSSRAITCSWMLPSRCVQVRLTLRRMLFLQFSCLQSCFLLAQHYKLSENEED